MHGLTAAQIGDVAAAHRIALHELTPQQASLEEAFMDITRDEVEFKAADADADEVGRMTASSANPTASSSPAAAASRSFTSSLSEWTKLRSVRSTRWSLLVAVVVHDRRSRLSPAPSSRTTSRR